MKNVNIMYQKTMMIVFVILILILDNLDEDYLDEGYILHQIFQNVIFIENEILL